MAVQIPSITIVAPSISTAESVSENISSAYPAAITGCVKTATEENAIGRRPKLTATSPCPPICENIAKHSSHAQPCKVAGISRPSQTIAAKSKTAMHENPPQNKISPALYRARSRPTVRKYSP